VSHTGLWGGGGRAPVRPLLPARGGRPTGVICSSDLMAIGVIHEAWAHGLRVPEDLSVVGFDGVDAAEWSEPPLTTVEQPIAELASTAVAALGALIAESDSNSGRSLPNYVFRPRLRLGRSTSPVSAATKRPKGRRAQ